MPKGAPCRKHTVCPTQMYFSRSAPFFASLTGGTDTSPCRREALEAERRQLPVWGARDALLAEVRANRALVVIGETGSGKTTQIPRMLMEAGLARGGMVACTQPRRVAAITVARRVAEEMGVVVGGTVGSRCHIKLAICREPVDMIILLQQWILQCRDVACIKACGDHGRSATPCGSRTSRPRRPASST